MVEAAAAEEAAEEAALTVGSSPQDEARPSEARPSAAKPSPAKRPRASDIADGTGAKGESISISSKGDSAPPASQFGFTASSANKKRARCDAGPGAGAAGASPFAGPIEWSIK
jgi:hypothetical protein